MPRSTEIGMLAITGLAVQLAGCELEQEFSETTLEQPTLIGAVTTEGAITLHPDAQPGTLLDAYESPMAKVADGSLVPLFEPQDAHAVSRGDMLAIVGLQDDQEITLGWLDIVQTNLEPGSPENVDPNGAEREVNYCSGVRGAYDSYCNIKWNGWYYNYALFKEKSRAPKYYYRYYRFRSKGDYYNECPHRNYICN